MCREAWFCTTRYVWLFPSVSFEVIGKVRLEPKSHFAYLAFERFLSIRNAKMAIQIPFEAECFSTPDADVWFFSRRIAAVTFEILLEVEYFATHFANVWFFTSLFGVRDEMRRKGQLGTESDFACLTNELLLDCMREKMQSEVVLHRERSLANSANVWLFAGVPEHVVLEVALLREPPLA